jgi:hypothetical protein
MQRKASAGRKWADANGRDQREFQARFIFKTPMCIVAEDIHYTRRPRRGRGMNGRPPLQAFTDGMKWKGQTLNQASEQATWLRT